MAERRNRSRTRTRAANPDSGPETEAPDDVLDDGESTPSTTPSREPKTDSLKTAEAAPLVLPGSERPDERFLSAWFTRNWNRFKPLRDLDEIRRAAVFRQTTPTHVGMQGEGNELRSEVTHSGTPRTTLREFVGILSGTPPRPEALAKGIGPIHQKRASVIEDWDRAWLNTVKGDKVIRQVDHDALLYARGLSLVVWAPHYWATLPTQNDDENDDAYLRRVRTAKEAAPQPIVWLHRPAPQCLWSDDDLSPFLGPARACHWELKPQSEIAERWPKSKLAREWDAKGNEPFVEDTDRIYLCWANRKYLVYATCGGLVPDREHGHRMPVSLTTTALSGFEILEVFPHNLDKCPYVVQRGPTTSDPDLVNQQEGVLDNSLGLMETKDNLLTQAITAARRYARAQGMIETAAPTPGNPNPGRNPQTGDPLSFAWEPDTVRYLGPGEKFVWAQPDLTALNALLQLVGAVEQDIQRDTLAPSSYGRGTATESGFQLVTLIQAGERKLQPTLQEKKEALESVIDLVHRWVQRIGHESGVLVKASVTEEGSGGAASGSYTREEFLTLTPKQAREASVVVNVEARLDSADAAAAQIGSQLSQLVASGGLDLDPAWIAERWFHIEDPARHMDAADLWRFLRTPEIQQWRIKRILEEADILEEKDTDKLIDQFLALTPEQQAKIPPIILSLLQAQGIQPALPGPTPMPTGGEPNGAVVGPNGPLPGPGGVTPQLANLMGQFAPEGPSNPMTSATTPGSPRLPGLGAAPAGPGGPIAALSPDVQNLGLAGFGQAGTPRTPREAGRI